MKVFISWSGAKGNRIGEIIRKWLPSVLQSVKPYFSPDDIAKGSRWTSEISKHLEESKFGVVCLTHDALESSWVMFEVGALSKEIENSRVCPILFGLDPADVVDPLAQFQSSKFEKKDIKRIVQSMNSALGDQGLATEVLDEVFDKWWPDLQSKVEAVLAEEEEENPERTDRDILEEILGRVRVLGRYGQRERRGSKAFLSLARSFLIFVEDVDKDDNADYYVLFNLYRIAGIISDEFDSRSSIGRRLSAAHEDLGSRLDVEEDEEETESDSD